MTKYEFLGDLSRLLSDLSEEERNEALQYYEDYFADAGRDQEQSIIRELESPEKIAAKIRGTDTEDVQYGEPGQMRDAAYPEVVNNSYQDAGKWGTGEGFGEENQSSSKNSASAGTASSDTSNRVLKWIVVIILAIFVAPIVIPLAGGFLITIACILFALFMALFGTGIGLGIGGVVSMALGLYHCITANIADAIVGIGAGLVMLPIGIILCYLGGLLVIKLMPGLWKLCQKMWEGLCCIGRKLFD